MVNYWRKIKPNSCLFFVRSSKNDRKRGFEVEKTFQADELPEKLPRLDISEVGNLEQRDVFHLRQDHPELEHCNTPPTSTTVSSQCSNP